MPRRCLEGALGRHVRAQARLRSPQGCRAQAGGRLKPWAASSAAGRSAPSLTVLRRVSGAGSKVSVQCVGPRLRPAGSPEAPLSARPCLRLPGPSANQPLGAALAGHTALFWTDALRVGCGVECVELQLRHLWCHGTRYVRNTRGWYVYGARTVAQQLP